MSAKGQLVVGDSEARLLYLKGRSGRKPGSGKIQHLTSKGVTWKFEVPSPLQAESIIRAGGTWFVAGRMDIHDSAKGGFLWALSDADGKITQKVSLVSPPVPDGISSANGRLFLATRDGKIRCLGIGPGRDQEEK